MLKKKTYIYMPTISYMPSLEGIQIEKCKLKQSFSLFFFVIWHNWVTMFLRFPPPLGERSKKYQIIFSIVLKPSISSISYQINWKQAHELKPSDLIPRHEVYPLLTGPPTLRPNKLFKYFHQSCFTAKHANYAV